MGLALRYNLFHDVTAPAVYGMLLNFYAQRDRPLQHTGTVDQRIDVYNADNGWVVVDLDRGWEWNERRQAQLYVSRLLGCAGFLVFIYDGNYWGYELFNQGRMLDQFTQEAVDTPIRFPDQPTHGNAALLSKQFPHLREDEIAPYLVQKHDWAIPVGANTKGQPGDEYRRFEAGAGLDFIRMLGVQVRIQNNTVQLTSSLYRSLWKTR